MRRIHTTQTITPILTNNMHYPSKPNTSFLPTKIKNICTYLKRAKTSILKKPQVLKTKNIEN